MSLPSGTKLVKAADEHNPRGPRPCCQSRLCILPEGSSSLITPPFPKFACQLPLLIVAPPHPTPNSQFQHEGQQHKASERRRGEAKQWLRPVGSAISESAAPAALAGVVAVFEESHPLKKPNRAPNHEYPKPEGKSKESGGPRIYHLQILTRAHTLIGFKKCEVSQLEPPALQVWAPRRLRFVQQVYNANGRPSDIW